MLLVSSWQAVGYHRSPLCWNTFNQPEPTVRARAPPGSPPARTEWFTSATSKRQLVFSNIVWQPSSLDYNVPTDSTNLSQPWCPLLRLYYNTVGALREERRGSSDCLEVLKTSWHFPRLQWGWAVSQHATFCVVWLKLCSTQSCSSIWSTHHPQLLESKVATN